MFKDTVTIEWLHFNFFFTFCFKNVGTMPTKKTVRNIHSIWQTINGAYCTIFLDSCWEENFEKCTIFLVVLQRELIETGSRNRSRRQITKTAIRDYFHLRSQNWNVSQRIRNFSQFRWTISLFHVGWSIWVLMAFTLFSLINFKPFFHGRKLLYFTSKLPGHRIWFIFRWGFDIGN